MRLQPLLVFFICAIVPFVAAGTIPRRTGFEVPNYNYDAMVKDQPMENEDKEVEERRSGRRTHTLNSGLLFGKRFEETDDFINDDETRQINVDIRGRNKLPFHSGLMQGKRNPQQEQQEISDKRSRPVFHSGFLMGKRYPYEIDDDLEEFKRKAGQRLMWSNGMQFGK